MVGTELPICEICFATSEKSTVDPFIKLRQELDQRAALMREVPPLLWVFHEQLVKEGFSSVDVIQLTRDYFWHTVGGSRS